MPSSRNCSSTALQAKPSTELLARIESAPDDRIAAVELFLAGEENRLLSTGSGGDSIDRLRQAIDAYQAAIAMNPSHYWSHLQLGRCYAGLGQYDLAIERQSACIAIRPDAPWAYSSRAVSRFFEKDYAGAEQDFTAGIERADGERRRRGLVMRASFWLSREDSVKALKDLDAADELSKTPLPESRLLRGRILLAQNKTDDAAKALTEARQLRPNLAGLPLEFAKLHLATNQGEEVILADVDDDLGLSASS